jgi:hypothetical protein
MKTVPLKTALQILRTGKKVAVEYCTLDDKRDSGGDRKTLRNVWLSSADSLHKSDSKTTSATHTNSPSNHTNPMHFKNNTLNFRDKDGNYTKVHIALMEKIDNHIILL